MRRIISAVACTLCTVMTIGALGAQEGVVEVSESVQKTLSKQLTSGPFGQPVNAWWITPTTSFDKTVPLFLVQIADADWTRDAIVSEVRTAEEVFSQCELSFDPIMLIRVDVNYTLAEMGFAQADAEQTDDWHRRQAIDLEMLNAFDFPRPILFYRNFGQSFAYSESIMAGVTESYAPLLGAAYITSETRDLQQDSLTSGHELGHLLLDQFHTDDPDNLMCADAGGQCGFEMDLTADQCANLDGWLDRLAPNFSPPFARP